MLCPQSYRPALLRALWLRKRLWDFPSPLSSKKKTNPTSKQTKVFLVWFGADTGTAGSRGLLQTTADAPETRNYRVVLSRPK